MAESTQREVELTVWLRRMSDGEPEAREKVASAVYAQLHDLAQVILSSERPDQSIQATLLVNEAFLRLINGQPITWHDSKHFYLVAARMMRHIIVDHVRQRRAQKRFSSSLRLPLEDIVVINDNKQDEILIMHEALDALASFDPRAARIVELRYFAGRDVAEIARLLAIGERTVNRDWHIAKAWLKSYIEAHPPASAPLDTK